MYLFMCLRPRARDANGAVKVILLFKNFIGCTTVYKRNVELLLLNVSEVKHLLKAELCCLF